MYALLLYLFVGKRVLDVLGIREEPKPLVWLQENKMYAMIGYFLINNLSASLLSTGAYEVLLNDKLVFSKIATGRPPAVEELVAILADKLGGISSADPFPEL
jgi:selT/selW/selH-like putative selenoprotein